MGETQEKKNKFDKVGNVNAEMHKSEEFTFHENGQWSLNKSNYGPKKIGDEKVNLYNQADNEERKSKNTGESLTDVGKNKNVKNYTTSGSSMQAASEKATAKEQAKKTKASTKIWSKEEIAALQAKLEGNT